MKVIAINGSPRIRGNDSIALDEVTQILEEKGVDVKTYQVGNLPITGCSACLYCKKNGRCVKDDTVNVVAADFKDAAGLIVSSPVYYASANGTLLSFLQRLFYSASFEKRMKVGASIAVARRAGTVSTFEEINRFFTICQMPIVSSTYWNDVFGLRPGEAKEDLEGLATMRNLARNMYFLMKAIEDEKEPLPNIERTSTNFIR